MMKLRTLSVMLAAVLAMMSLAACGGKGDSASSTNGASESSAKESSSTADATKDSSAKSKKSVTLSFVISNTVDPNNFKDIIASYEKETGNKIEIQSLPGGDFDNMMKTRFSTGDYPDLFLMQPGIKQNIKLRAPETLYDWSGETEVLDRLLPSIKDAQVDNGKIYGVPFGKQNVYGIFYNKAVFDKVGVQPPKNYDDLISIAEKIKGAGITPFYEGVKDGWPAQIFYLSGWVSNVDPAIGDEGVVKLNKNELKMNEIPQLKTLFEKQKQIYDLGLYQDNVLSGTYDQMQDMLGQGKAAMAFTMGDMVLQLEKKFGKDFVTNNVGFFPFPSDTDQGVTMSTQPDQVMVPSQAKHKQEAIDFVKFMVKPESVNQYYAISPGIPIFKDAQVQLYPVQETAKQLIESGKSKMNIQNRLTPTFADFQKLLQTFFLDRNVDKAYNDFATNYEKDGKAKLLEGFK